MTPRFTELMLMGVDVDAVTGGRTFLLRYRSSSMIKKEN